MLSHMKFIIKVDAGAVTGGYQRDPRPKNTVKSYIGRSGNHKDTTWIKKPVIIRVLGTT